MKKINIIFLIIGVLWCGFWFGMVGSKIGEMTEGPYLITVWDAVWMPFAASVLPFLLGMGVFRFTEERRPS